MENFVVKEGSKPLFTGIDKTLEIHFNRQTTINKSKKVIPDIPFQFLDLKSVQSAAVGSKIGKYFNLKLFSILITTSINFVNFRFVCFRSIGNYCTRLGFRRDCQKRYRKTAQEKRFVCYWQDVTYGKNWNLGYVKCVIEN